jgi:hypothetical protein
MVSSEFLAAFTGVLAGYDGSQGTVLGEITASALCPDRSGWAVSLTDVDGGALPDGGYIEVYLGSSGLPDPALTATSSEGAALFYDVDVSITNYFGVSASKPDAGGCGIVPGGSSYTGRLYVAGTAVSAYVFQVP